MRQKASEIRRFWVNPRTNGQENGRGGGVGVATRKGEPDRGALDAVIRNCQEHLLETVQLGVEGASGAMRFRHGVRPVRYDSVRASRGLVNTVSVGPYSSSSPRSRNPVRSDSRAACQRLRVAITIE